MKFYTMSTLIKRVKEAGFSTNRSYLIVWEQQGLIPKPKNVLITGVASEHRLGFLGRYTGEIRLYTEEDIDKIIDIVSSRQ